MQICHCHRQCALWKTARVFGKFTAVISLLVCWSAVGGFFAPSVVLAAVLVHQYKHINDTGRLEALMLKVFYHIFLGIYNLSSRRLPRWTRTSVWFCLQDRQRAPRLTICVCCGGVTRWFDPHHASSAAWKFVGRGPGLRQADWDHGRWWSPVCAWHCRSQQRLTSIRSHVCWATRWDSTLTGVLVGPHVCAQSDMYGHGALLFFLNWMIWKKTWIALVAWTAKGPELKPGPLRFQAYLYNPVHYNCIIYQMYSFWLLGSILFLLSIQQMPQIRPFAIYLLVFGCF